MSFTLAADVRERPIAIDGAGTLGRRIASVFVAGGADVRLHDVSSEQLEACRRFVGDSTPGWLAQLAYADDPGAARGRSRGITPRALLQVAEAAEVLLHLVGLGV